MYAAPDNDVIVFWLCRSSKQAVEEQKKLESVLSVDVDTARVRINEIQTELESVVEQLGEAKVGFCNTRFCGECCLCLESVSVRLVILLQQCLPRDSV